MPASSSPPRRARHRRLLLVLLAAATSCHEVPSRPVPELRVVRRLLDDGFRTAAAPFTHRGVESLAGVRKLVVAAATPIDPSTVCLPRSSSPTRPCTITVPRSTPAVPSLIVETGSLPLLRAGAKPRAVRGHLQKSADLRRRRRFVLRRQPLDDVPMARNLRFWMTPGLRAWPVLGIGARDVASHPISIPADAVLTFAVGIQEPAWYVDSAPVQFTIEARGPGVDVELYRRALDPARRPEDRRWFDERVSLGAVAGRTVILRFRVHPLHAGDRRPHLPMWADPTLLAPPAAPSPPPPSIVLVSLDTLRAKSMSTFGYAARETTPRLSRFATTATRFAHAYTTFSNTLGAHISMLTGTYPGRHGIRHPRELAPDIPTLAELLRAAGYDTAAFTEDALLDASMGFQRGFAHYWENTAIETGAGDAPGTFGRALAWLAGHRDRPFFLFVHTYAVHAPYTPSPPYDTLFGDAPGTAPNMELLPYEREIRQLDDDVARLVAGLDALVPPERFVLVITADHGEEFLEHQGTRHTQLYDETLHVPLLFRWPGHVPAGRTLDTQVSLIDVAPTLLDLAGLGPAVADGQTLRPLLEGTATTLEREVILAAAPWSPFSRHAWSFVARRPDAKCFSYELTSLDCCFDLVRDPSEARPLAPTRYTALWEAARAHGEVVLGSTAPAAAAPTAAATTDPLHVDPERVLKLRALGYLE